MKSIFYLPVLKSKNGEFVGLEKLEARIKENIVPLWDITPLEWDNSENKVPKTMEEHLQSFCKKYIKKWGNAPAFIDVNLIDREIVYGNSTMYYVLKELKSQGMKPYPIMRLKSNSKIVDDVGIIDMLYGIEHLGLRVTIEDVLSPSFSTQINDLLKKLDRKPGDCHLVLDLKDSDFSNIEDFSDAIVDCLMSFPFLKAWRSFTICGGAFPQTSTLKPGIKEIERGDWQLYNAVLTKLNKAQIKLSVNFGDYGISAPGYFLFDPKKMSRSGNIKYTSKDKWFVVKGSKLKKSEDYKQYYEHAKSVVASKHFMGETYSFGDKRILDCSMKKTSTGSPSVWTAMGYNHHFTRVVLDLFSRKSDF